MIPITDRVVDPAVLDKAVAHCRSRNIILPTFAEQRDPALIPGKIKDKLRRRSASGTSTRSTSSASPGRTSPRRRAASSAASTASSCPAALTGVQARIVGLVGKYFPTGAHKVGAAFGCLVPRLVSGEFDPDDAQGGLALDRQLLPRRRLRLRPAGLHGRRHPARGDEPRALRLARRRSAPRSSPRRAASPTSRRSTTSAGRSARTRPDCVIFNQFDEFGNSFWHYHVHRRRRRGGLPPDRAAPAPPGRLRLRHRLGRHHRRRRLPAQPLPARSRSWRPRRCSARRCCSNGFGAHRIEGIGDKHVPWVHNVRNTDMVAAIDDEQCMRLLPPLQRAGRPRAASRARAWSRRRSTQLPLLGISGICNLLAAIKTAKYYELDGGDVIFTPAHRLHGPLRARAWQELTAERGAYTRDAGGRRPASAACWGQGDDHFKELDLPRPQGAAQPQVLHLGRAAGQGDRRPEPALAGPRHLAEHLRPGRSAGTR